MIPRATDVLALVLLSSILLAPAARAAEELDRIVLRVNDQILTLYDYEERKSAEIRSILASDRLTADQRQQRLSEAGQFLMQQIFREMLLLSRARQMGVRGDDAEVEASIDRIQQQQGMTSRRELEQALAAADMTMDDLRGNLERELLWSQVIGREVTQQIEIGEEELRAYYREHPDEFQVAEERQIQEVIVLESSGLAAEERAATAAAIVDALARGRSLAEAVEPYEAKGITTGVIDLGWLERGELEADIADVAWSLAPGSFSQPVAARGGLHILQVAGLKEGAVRPFSEVQEFIFSRERARRFDSALEDYIARLADRAYIQEDLPPEAVGYRSFGGGLDREDELELFRRPIEELARQQSEAAAEEAAPEDEADAAADEPAPDDESSVDDDG